MNTKDFQTNSSQNTSSKCVSIVSPVYNESEGIAFFTEAVAKSLSKVDMNWELILCVDPSTDGTERIIRKLCEADPRIKMIRFSRKFGQDIAVFAGLHYATGDSVVVMDSDLQDPPDVVVEMIQAWQSGALIVLARRVSRGDEPWLKKLTSKYFYRFLNRFAKVDIPLDTGDFRLLDRSVVTELNRFKESRPFLKGLVSLVGYETIVVEFHRPDRKDGITKYNKFFGGYGSALNGIVGFSTILLNISVVGGLLCSALSILVGIGYEIAKILGHSFPTGNPTIVLFVTFLGGLNLLAIGILGLYVERIHEEVKERPRFIVQELIGFEDKN